MKRLGGMHLLLTSLRKPQPPKHQQTKEARFYTQNTKYSLRCECLKYPAPFRRDEGAAVSSLSVQKRVIQKPCELHSPFYPSLSLWLHSYYSRFLFLAIPSSDSWASLLMFRATWAMHEEDRFCIVERSALVKSSLTPASHNIAQYMSRMRRIFIPSQQ